MVVQIAPWFMPETLSVGSVLVVLVCAALFIHYVWVFDRMIDLEVADVRWVVILVTDLLVAGECTVMGMLYRRGRAGTAN